MKKKLLTGIISVVFAMSLMACGKAAEEKTEATTVATTESTTEAETTEAETTEKASEVTIDDVTESTTAAAANDGKTLEEVFTQEMIEEAERQLKSANDGVYSDVKITVDGNDITYACVFSNSIQITDAVKTQLEGMDWSTTIQTSKEELLKQYNLNVGVLTFVFYDSEGNEVLTIAE